MSAVKRGIRKTPTWFQHIYYKLIPFANRYGRVYKQTLDFIMESQWWPRERLEAYQWNELQKLLRHVYKNVPYYTKLFKQNDIIPSDISSLEYFKQIPMLTRNVVKKNLSELIARNIDPQDMIKFSTSGSTGAPIIFWGTDDLYKAEAAFIYRAMFAHGIDHYGERVVWLRRYIPEEGQPLYYMDYELNRLYLSPYHISTQTVQKYINIIEQSGSTVLVAYPSSAYILAMMCEQTGTAPPKFRTIHVSSEQMLPDWKQKIEDVFQTEVKEHYGMVERVSLMFQCQNSNFFHDNLEYGITEYYTDEDTGQTCIVGTGFLNYTTPFIRYKMGDCVTLNQGSQTCSCGRGLPLVVHKIDGRTSDILITKDGKMLPGVNFYVSIGAIEEIDMFQIEQYDIDSVTIHVVPHYTADIPNMLAKLDVTLRRYLGKDCQIEFDVVTEIKRNSKTGKIKSIINHML